MRRARGATRASVAPDIDALDAAGAFGLLSGGLSLAVPYFLGPAMALAGLLLVLAVVRRPDGPNGPRRPLALPIACALAGWGVALLAPLGAWRGLVLAAGCAPLWWSARGGHAFGGA